MALSENIKRLQGRGAYTIFGFNTERLFEPELRKMCLPVEHVFGKEVLKCTYRMYQFWLNCTHPSYKIKIRKCMCTLQRASEKAPRWSSMT